MKTSDTASAIATLDSAFTAMKVFISWSGERSRLIAEALRTWLQTVIQAVEPWMSKADIQKGARWGADLAAQLEETKVGIICLTPDNINKPWILFEAGALSKTLPDTYVCPLLFGLQPSDIEGPLAQFQATLTDKDDLRSLIQTINEALKQDALSPEVLDRAFELAWPDLEHQLSKVPSIPLAERYERSTNEIVREILDRIRADQREAEIREDAYYKTRDSYLSFMVELFQAGFANNSEIPLEIQGKFEELKAHISRFLDVRDIRQCPDCLGTGWTFIQDKGIKRCEHIRLNKQRDISEEQDENINP